MGSLLIVYNVETAFRQSLGKSPRESPRGSLGNPWGNPRKSQGNPKGISREFLGNLLQQGIPKESSRESLKIFLGNPQGIYQRISRDPLWDSQGIPRESLGNLLGNRGASNWETFLKCISLNRASRSHAKTGFPNSVHNASARRIDPRYPEAPISIVNILICQFFLLGNLSMFEM